MIACGKHTSVLWITLTALQGLNEQKLEFQGVREDQVPQIVTVLSFFCQMRGQIVLQAVSTSSPLRKVRRLSMRAARSRLWVAISADRPVARTIDIRAANT